MTQHLLTYFAGEKLSAAVFMLIGAAALGFSSFLWKANSPYKAMIIPLVAIGLIQLVVGGTVFFRTDSQVAALLEQLNTHPMDFRAEEMARMKKVLDSFALYKAVEILLLSAGIFMTFSFRQNLTLYAVAIGLIAQASILLVADLIAEYRADMYFNRLLEFVPEL
jgi:hypothetical protein